MDNKAYKELGETYYVDWFGFPNSFGDFLKEKFEVTGKRSIYLEESSNDVYYFYDKNTVDFTDDTDPDTDEAVQATITQLKTEGCVSKWGGYNDLIWYAIKKGWLPDGNYVISYSW